jgi:hypothetical protein
MAATDVAPKVTPMQAQIERIVEKARKNGKLHREPGWWEKPVVPVDDPTTDRRDVA